MTTLNLNIPEEMSSQIETICQRRRCSLEEAVCDVLRRWIAIEQFRSDADEVRNLAQAAGYRSETDILEGNS